MSGKIKEAFVKHPNWRKSERDLREIRQETTFAIYAEEDDLDKVTAVVDDLFTILSKTH